LLDTVFIEGEDGFVNVVSQKWFSPGRGRRILGLGKPLKQEFKELKLTAKDVLYLDFMYCHFWHSICYL